MSITDIVERLNVSLNQESKSDPPVCFVGKATVREAIAEIVRLREELATDARDWEGLHLRVEEATKRAEAATAEMEAEWQLIETAPRDGALFLAWAPGAHGLKAIYSLCAWHPGAGFCIDELREPTHWRPLPDPPARHSATAAPAAPSPPQSDAS